VKILLANYEYPGVTENCGGGGEVTRLLATELVHRGHTVRVVTDQNDGSHLTFPVRLYGKLRRVFQGFQPDVVNAHFSIPTGLPLARLCEQCDVPLVTSVMGADVFDPTRYQRVRPLLDAANDYVCKRSERVVTPSSDMAARVPERYADRARTIHYGVDVDEHEWRPKSLSDPVRVLSVCRLVERKQLPVAIEATRRLRDDGWNIEHTIVGTGPLLDSLREDHAGREWLSLPGYVPDLDAVFASSDVFVLPSAHEAFGMAFVEALGAGLPVVTSDTGGQTDIVTDLVGEVAAPTPSAQANALERVLENYDARQLGTRGYVARNFGAEKMAAEYEGVYEAAV
jgi:glycosyltransferase involved in cell wall biosynthesis